ncbi:SDR family oxidoreductase [Cystobacter ferrugineus]|uniref:NAD(P)-dependent oxidoreductase n=1 Tax=Cystobacter ferrugineus TaxID=83449 RepID=A0A1L9B3Y6_9BACT|nr:SDR family oxidoreductase [Cystobacter ferrugineus]OJH36920.1 NAD(P)-dependent oxidoreductase [Cystobacter ferrugineus]
MIVITGATGQLGHLIVEKLLARVPVEQVGVSVRDPEKAQDLAARGVRVRRGDFTDPKSLTQAFEGASQVLLVSSNAAAYGGDTLAQHRSAIDAARASGARRVVYTSHMAASPSSAFPPAIHHAVTEQMLRGSGLAWTALRNGFYASSARLVLEQAVKTGVLETSPDGKIAWTTHADLAEAAAVILANEGQYDGPTPPLTAAEALDFGELCAVASDLLGRPIRRGIVPEEQLRANFAALGMPAMAIERSLGLYRASHNGEFATIDPTLQKLLGRVPTRVHAVLADTRGRTAATGP